jgi:predicted phosphoribosyltransferase
LRHLADVVAVIEGRHTGLPEVDHRLDVVLHLARAAFSTACRIALALGAPLGHIVQPFGR